MNSKFFFLLFFLLMFVLISCGFPGALNEPCKSDGTCNSPNLMCSRNGYCVSLAAKEPARHCHFESECFCVTCSEKCSSSGVKVCAFSDTSVWGSKPAICECKLWIECVITNLVDM